MSYRYSAHPAWRTSWFIIGVALALTLVAAALFLIPLFEQPPQNLVAEGFLVVVAVVWLFILFKHFSWRFVITDDVIESHHGIIGRELKSVRIQDLRNVNVRQSLFQRIFDIGDVEFSSAGGAGVEVVFFSIAGPMRVKEKVQELQDRYDAARSGD